MPSAVDSKTYDPSPGMEPENRKTTILLGSYATKWLLSSSFRPMSSRTAADLCEKMCEAAR